MQFYCQNTIRPKRDTKLCLRVEKWSRSYSIFFLIFTQTCWILLFVSFSCIIRQYFCLWHVLFLQKNNFALAQTLYRMSSLCRSYECVNIVWVNIGVLTGWKKIKLRRISFLLGYLRMIFLWKISTAIKHRILTTFDINKNSILTACMPLILKLNQMGWLKMLVILYSASSFIGNSSDKLRRVSLQNWFSLSEKLSNPSFLSIISYLRHIVLYTLGITDLTA